jgi:hypothetical protein
VLILDDLEHILSPSDEPDNESSNPSTRPQQPLSKNKKRLLCEAVIPLSMTQSKLNFDPERKICKVRDNSFHSVGGETRGRDCEGGQEP